MFLQPPIENWIIFVHENDSQYLKRLMSNLKDTVTTFNYFTKEPKTVLLKGT